MPEPLATRPRIVIVGARRTRSGIGRFVARDLAELGATVAGVVGSTAETAREAARSLRTDFGIETTGYASLDDALAASHPDAVCVCSPIRFHAEHVRAALSAGAHVLCDKPFVGVVDEPAAPALAAELVDLARDADRHLGLLAQWPEALPAYFELLGRTPHEQRPPERFGMLLAPGLTGDAAVEDVCAHPLSLLSAVCGPGEAVDARRRELPDGSQEVAFGWRHRHGTTRAEIRLAQCATPPRPAGFGFDDAWVAREVEPTTYAMRLVATEWGAPHPTQRESPSVALPDPLRARLRRFLGDLARGAAGATAEVVESTVALRTLVHACPTGG